MSALKVCPQCGSEYELDQRFCPRDGTTLRTQNTGSDLVGDIIADRYHVLKKLGEGGMGTVYLAEHVKMGRRSAVKVMNPGMVNDADAISRFNREASNASRINHPNVAAIYDFGETPEGLIYLAMEFVEGDSLTKVIERQGALPASRAAEITRQASEALSVAHDMGIVHRDLKPDNIMLAKNRDGSDCVKVVDFGIAKASQSEAQKVTKTGLVVGTPEYMSPEQLAGDKLDGRSDIYSLALVAFNMLTGKLPFPSETVQESMIMRLTDRPKTLAEMKPDVPWPAELQTVMDRALARDAKERYQHANELGRDLVKAVQHMPMTVAAEMGTAVLSAVPPTRVAPGSPAGAGAVGAVGAAGGAGATKVASAGPAALPVAVRPRSRMPILAGGALVAALAAGGAFVATRKDAPGPVTSDTARQVATALPSPTDTSASVDAARTANPAAGSVGQTKAPAGSRVVPSPTTKTGSAPPGPGTVDRTEPSAPRFDTNGMFARVDKLVESSDSVDMQRALSVLRDALPRLVTHEDSIRALYLRASAMAILDQSNVRACPILQSIMDQSDAKHTVAARTSFKEFGCP